MGRENDMEALDDRGIVLRVVSGLHAGAERELAGGEMILIGSGDDCDMVLADAGVAARHALLSFVNGRFSLRALDAPLHVATAAGTPTVSLFGPTDPERNGPYAPEDVAVSRFTSCGCHYDRRCHQAAWCLDTVTAPEVSAAIQQRLGGARG